MELNIYQIDAFTQDQFKGNPAAVCPLENWISDEIMQAIAMENNLSETVFYVKEGDVFHIRWFTPEVEVKMCGHATLATAYVMFEVLKYPTDKIVFSSKSGQLEVVKETNGMLTLNFPVTPLEKCEIPSILEEALNTKVLETFTSMDLVVLLPSQSDVVALNPNFELVKNIRARGVVVTAPGDDVDFVSRFFGPQSGVNEDPVTGSAHTILAPFWGKKLNKTKMVARQLSKRGGEVICELEGDRVKMSGYAKCFMKGTIFLD